MQESGYKLGATNTHCGFTSEDASDKTCVITDFGISQIHYKNVVGFNLDKKRLLADLDYSIDAGAMILSQYSSFKTHEPASWFCRYNQGRRAFSVIKDECQLYKGRVSRYL